MDISDFTFEGLDSGIFANLFIQDNALYVEFTNVPEPAAFAGIFGIFALFLAVRRKK